MSGYFNILACLYETISPFLFISFTSNFTSGKLVGYIFTFITDRRKTTEPALILASSNCIMLFLFTALHSRFDKKPLLLKHNEYICQSLCHLECVIHRPNHMHWLHPCDYRVQKRRLCIKTTSHCHYNQWETVDIVWERAAGCWVCFIYSSTQIYSLVFRYAFVLRFHNGIQ